MKMHQRPIPADFVTRTMPCGCCPPFQLCAEARALLDAEFDFRDAGEVTACRQAAAAYDAHIAPALAYLTEEVPDVVYA